MKKYGKRKRVSLLALILAVAFLFGLLPAVSLPVTAASPAADFEFDETTGTITKYIGSETEVIIPEAINGVAVTKIGFYAFSGCSSLTSIAIPDSVTEIGLFAFKGCTSLTSITIPAGVTEICDDTFAGCESLTSVTIPDSVTEIGVEAFCGCSSLASITIPESVTGIYSWAFADCTSLKSVVIPQNVEILATPTFQGCTLLTDIQVDKNNKYFSSVDGILFSKDKKELFYCPEGKSGDYRIPDGVEYIWRDAFFSCALLSSITSPDSLKGFDNQLYWYYSIQGEIPDVWKGSMTMIIGRTFSGCSSLTSITIPDSVTKIAENAFSGCESLTRLNLQNSAGTLSLSVSVSVSADVEDNAVLRVLYPGTEEDWSAEWEASGIQNDSLRVFLTSRVVYGSSEAFVWGDADGNGKVESKDKVLVSRYLAKWAMDGGFKKAAADFNKDGDVTSAEAVVLARYLAKWTNLPYPVGQKVS